MRPLLIAVVVGLCACSAGTAPPVASASTTATSSRISYPGSPANDSLGRYAVMQQGDGQIDLVSLNRVYAVASVGFVQSSFRPNAGMPFTSASSTRLYYLTNGSDLGYLTPTGEQRIVRSIPLVAGEELGIAVSPDDKRVAVTIFTYASADSGAIYDGMQMYVEDVADGGNRVEIFASSTVAEFPIGWVGGNLVVAVGAPFCCVAPLANPYGADSYHVVDAGTGRRLRSICGAQALPQGPVEPIGVMCGLRTFVHWDGTPFPSPAAVPDPGANRVALSPDGTAVLFGGSPVQVIRGVNEFALGESGVALGWVDGIHVVVATPDNFYWLFDSRTGDGTQLPGDTGYLGAFPAAIS